MMNISLNKDTHLSSFATVDVEIGQTYNIEYFPKTIIPLKFLSTSSIDLEKSLNELCDGNPISVDFEWKPDIPNSFHPIAIFQFCSSKGIIVIENDDILLSKNDDENINDNDDIQDITNVENYNILKNFLINHQFFGKGTTTDKMKLKMMFDYDFEIEDIEVTFLKPNNLPLGFSTIVQKLIGRPSAHFKDIKVSRSDWSKRPLSVLQLLYAGFDAYSMHLCYNKIIKLNKEEITALFDKENNAFTKKHKLKSDLAKEQSLKIKISFIISFNGNLKNSGSLRNQEVDPMKFIPHDEYSAKHSLFHMYLALRKVELINGHDPNGNNNDDSYRCIQCNKILSNKTDTIEHLWSYHYNDIPSIYFLWQSPAYLCGCIKQIALASQNFVTEEDHLKCTICGKQLQKFRNLYTHFRMFHMVNQAPSEKVENEDNKSTELTVEDYSKVDSNIDLKLILYEHLNKTGKIDKNEKKCHICEKFLNDQKSLKNSESIQTSSVKIIDPRVHFDNESDLINHCWSNHPGIFISLWKHRPSPYPKDLYEKCDNFGRLVIEKLLSGTMYNGVYACSFCLVGFDTPGELFIHLFHRHTVIQTVRAADIDCWPFKIKDLPMIMQAMFRKMCFNDAIASLEKEGILSVNREAKIELSPPKQSRKSKKAQKKSNRNESQKQSNQNESQKQSNQNESQKQSNQNESQEQSNQNESQEQSNQNESQKQSNQNESQKQSNQNESQKQSNQNESQKQSNQNESQKQSNQNESQKQSNQNESQEQSNQNESQKQSNQNESQEQSNQNESQKQSNQNESQKQSNQNESQEQSNQNSQQDSPEGSKKSKKSRKLKKADDDDSQKEENPPNTESTELQLYPFYCNECQVNLLTADERWNHLLEKHLIIDFSAVRYRCHDDLPFLSED